MSFGTPLFFWILPGVSFVLLIDGVLRAQRKKKLNAWIDPAIQTRTRSSRIPDVRGFRAVLWSLGILLIAFSLTRPQWGYTWRDASREGLDLVVVIDTSNSMRADDFTPSRLQRAKWGVEELVGALAGDRVGLVAFAGEAMVQCPLTRDYGAFMMNIEDLYPGILPQGGTNLAKALETSADAFEETTEADKVILLITDGEQHDGDLDSISGELKEQGIRVFAVGVGTEDGSLIPLDASGSAFLKNRQGEVVKSWLDESTLRELARDTDGLYVRSDPRDFGVRAIIEDGLKPLQRAQLESKRVKEMEERYQIFLGLGVLCLLLESFTRLPAVWRAEG
jgi:Ca-activated chloride channel family protein